MTDILIVYGSTEGQTAKIARHLADVLTRRRDAVTIVDASELPGDIDVAAHDGVIVCASVHGGRHQASVHDFVRSNARALTAKPSAFVSVSLTAAGTEAWEKIETRAYAERFFEETGWRPRAEIDVAGAMRFTRYDFFRQWIVRRVAQDRGVAFAPGEEVEFTDWAALERFAAEFARIAEAGS